MASSFPARYDNLIARLRNPALTTDGVSIATLAFEENLIERREAADAIERLLLLVPGGKEKR